MADTNASYSQSRFMDELHRYERVVVRMKDLVQAGIHHPELFDQLLNQVILHIERLRGEIATGRESEFYYVSKLGSLRGLLNAAVMIACDFEHIEHIQI